ncbi:MAG: DUF1801 domain-containing protein [Hyphomonadaceae bacterium]|nr:DUF1801 domain-containing protein [Hyphomonadaceae bacterium]
MAVAKKAAVKKAPAKARSGADWRVETLDGLRKIIMGAAPGIVETVKWRKPSNPAGVPVWEANGIICTGERYKDKVKLTFMYGAKLKDPSGLFNAGMDGGTRRAIDVVEGGKVNEKALAALVREAVKFNLGK